MKKLLFILAYVTSAYSYANDCPHADDLARQAQRVDNTQAITLYRQAIDLCPDNAQFHYQLGIALMQADNFADAAAAFKHALQQLNTTNNDRNYVNKRFSLLLRQAENQLAWYNKSNDHHRGEVLQSLSSLHAYGQQHNLPLPEAFASLEQPFYDQLNSNPLKANELKIAMRSVRDLAVEAPLAMEYRIPFDFNSDSPSSEGINLLKQIAESLAELSLKRVTIIGHTDSSGDAKYNLRLSERRAQSVKRLVLQQQPPLKGKLQAKGVGETQPRYSTHIPEQDSLNRRVEFILND